MRKINLAMFIIAVIAIFSLVMSINTVYAEDQKPKSEKDKSKDYDPCGDMNCLTSSKVDMKDKPCGDQNCGTGNPCKCADRCGCPAMKKSKNMDMKNEGMMMCQMCKQKMGKGMMCPMMEKMMKDNMPMKEAPMHILGYADKLQLTKEQRDKIDSIHTAHKKDMIKKQAELQIANVDLEDLMKKEEPNISAISDQIKKISSMEADIKIAQIKIKIDVKSVLTKDQQDNLKMIKKHELHQTKMDDKPEAKPMHEHEKK